MVSEFHFFCQSQSDVVELEHNAGNFSGYLLDSEIYIKSLYIEYQNILKKKPHTNVTPKSWIINIITAKITTIGNVLRKAFFLNNPIILGSISFSVFKVAIQLYSYKFIDLSVADFRRKQYV